jgi:hypothetical protein
MIHRAAAILIPAFLAGCSASRYEVEYAERVGAYRHDADFACLAAEPTAFADDRMRLRLPRQFASQVPPDADPSRLKPPFVKDFPGFVVSHEAMLQSTTTRLPATLSIGVWRGKQADVEKTILAQVVADEAFAAAKPRWDKVTVTGSGGEPAAWSRLTLGDKQLFESVVAGNPELKKWDAACQIWVLAGPRQDLGAVLAWRVPTEMAGKLDVPLDMLASTVARTVQFPPPPAPAAGK